MKLLVRQRTRRDNEAVVDLTKVKHVYSDDDDNNIAVTDVIIIIACFAF